MLLTILTITFAILFFVAIALCAIIYISAQNSKKGIIEEFSAKASDYESRISALTSQSAALNAEKDALHRELEQMRITSNEWLEQKVEAQKFLAASEEKINSLSERLKDTQEQEKSLHEKLTKDFENLSNKIFEASREKLSTANAEQLSLILNPLKSNLKDFRDRIETLNTQTSAKNEGMQVQIKNLLDMNVRLSEDANNLTQALRGKNKIAGNWGEMVLERIFENCGFKEGIHFRSQNSFRDDSGTQLRLMPDFIIDLPDSRSIVVDSKLSLVNYVDYCSEQEQSLKRSALEKFKKSVRTHLDEFADKYNNLPDINCGFKLMFLPIEPAYDLVMSEDKTLASDAYARNVLIVGPASVMSVLKFAEITLRNAAVEKNSQEIAKLGVSLYERVNLFLKRFQKLGERLEQLSKEYEQTSVTLSQGGKSVAATAKRLGAKCSGEILELEIQEEKEDE